MSRLSTLALYLTLCTKLVTSQTAKEICAADPTNGVACFDACVLDFSNDQACCASGHLTACTDACKDDPTNIGACTSACNNNNHQACCAAGLSPIGNECLTACQEDNTNHQACCAAGLSPIGNACLMACDESPDNHQACCAVGDPNGGACSEVCAADNTNHQACCAAGDIKVCCDVDGADATSKKAGCCYKALTDDDPATVCLVTPIDSAELKKQQNSAPC